MDSVGGHAEPGNSALGQAVLFGREADAVERQIAELTTGRPAGGPSWAWSAS